MTSTIPALIMFTITVLIVALLFLPATYERRSPVWNFYWTGTWLFLGLIMAIAGAEQTLLMLNVDASAFATRLLTAATVCFPLFIIAAWLRLSGAAFLVALKAMKQKTPSRAVSPGVIAGQEPQAAKTP